MARVPFIATVVVLLFVSAILSYFVLVNTVLADKVLPNLSIESIDTSLMSQEEIEKVILQEVRSKLPESINISIAGYSYTVPTTELVTDVLLEQDIIGYGKGPDIVKVLTDAIELIDGEVIKTELRINPYPAVTRLPLKIRSEFPAYIANNVILKCDTGQYNLGVDYPKLANILRSAINGSLNIKLELGDILTDPAETAIIGYCQRYSNEINNLDKELGKIGIERSQIQLGLSVVGTTYWKLESDIDLYRLLTDIRTKTKVSPKEGDYEFINRKIALLSPYKEGKDLNIVESIAQVETLLDNPNLELSLVYDSIAPKVLGYGLDILDFTYTMGSGKTRIDLIRNGSINWVVKNAQAGVEEMHNVMVMPGKEFSMYKTFNPQPGGWTDDGRPIGYGTSNSATTVFRAALEAGLPITDHSPHPAYYSSYEWDYPDLVDATFYSDPVVDVKFVNDTDYPVLLRAVISQDSEGWQYHTLNVLTSVKAPKRDVNITNFQRWNISSERSYDSSFERIVKENGVVISKDKYTASYR